MLVLSRKVGERIRIGDGITITVVRVNGGGVRLGIEAPLEMSVVREEIYDQSVQTENQDSSGNHTAKTSSKNAAKPSPK